MRFWLPCGLLGFAGPSTATATVLRGSLLESCNCLDSLAHCANGTTAAVCGIVFENTAKLDSAVAAAGPAVGFAGTSRPAGRDITMRAHVAALYYDTRH
jgi:hypothetical protein